MAYEFRLEDPGEGIHEAEILELLVSKGDKVKEGDDVLVAETDKAAVEIPSPVDGEIVEIKVSEGDIVEVGDVLMVIEEADAAEAGESREEEADEAEEEKEKEKEQEKEQDEDEEKDEDEDEEKEEDEDEDEDEEEETEQESEAKPEPKKREAAGAEAETEARGKRPSGDRPALATPAVRKLAKEHDIDLKSIDGSGKDGRVLKEDVQALIESGTEEGAERRAKEGKRAAEKEEGKREPLRSIRRATARRMAKSWAEIPHVTHYEKIEITEMEQVRNDHAGTVEAEGGKLTLTPFLIKALAAALREHPRFNARLDMEQEEIVYQDALNIGVALDTERGLMVPVIREVDRKSVIDLALELGELADKLRDTDRASRDLLRGGTFTLTNVGALGGTGFSPIINHPEVAIFGAARARLEQVVEGTTDAPAQRTALMLPVCVAFDHRVNDGADAARFMNTVKRLLEDPDELLIRN